MTLRVSGLAQHAYQRIFGHVARLQLGVLGHHLVARRRQHAVEAPQHHHRQHDQPILRRPVRSAQAVGDLPDLPLEFFVQLLVHFRPFIYCKQS